MPAHIRFVDHSKQWLDGFTKVIDNRMDKAADELANAMRENLRTPGPEPSQPGEYPHRQSGDLEGSIYWHRDTRGGRIIGSTSDHSLPLEKKSQSAGGRPFMLKSLYETWNRIKRIMAGR